jgi:hypothetical protein
VRTLKTAPVKLTQRSLAREMEPSAVDLSFHLRRSGDGPCSLVVSKFAKHPKYSDGFDTAAYRMTVPEGYARYAVLEGFGPGGAGLTIRTETAPVDAFQVDQLPPTWDPKPPAGACLTIRIGAKKPGSGKIRLLFKGNDYSEPLPVQVPADGSGTVRSPQDAYQLSNRALIKAKERLEELRNSGISTI